MTSLWRHSRLTYYDLGPNFLTQGVGIVGRERYGKFQREIPSTSGAICEKPQGGPFGPPSGARVNGGVMNVTNAKLSAESEKFTLKIRSESGKLFTIGRHFPPTSTNFGHCYRDDCHEMLKCGDKKRKKRKNEKKNEKAAIMTNTRHFSSYTVERL